MRTTGDLLDRREVLRLTGKRRGAALDLCVSAGSKRPKRQRRRAGEPDHLPISTSRARIKPVVALKWQREQSASQSQCCAGVGSLATRQKCQYIKGPRRAEEGQARRIEHPFCVAARDACLEKSHPVV
jgi:hypothetical protein